MALGGNTTQKQVYIWWSADGTTMVPVSTANPLPVTSASGGGGGTSSSFTATFPTTGTAIGAEVQTTNPTPTASGQMVSLTADKEGKLITVDAIRTLKLSQKTTISNTTAETTIVTAGAAGVFNDIFALLLVNSGASSTKVDIRDATSGSIIATLYVPAGDMRGFTLPAGSGYSQTTAANNWTAQCSTATTALEVTAQYVVNI